MILAFLLLAASLANGATVTRTVFGKTADGQPVELFTLTNANGVQIRITNYGAIIVSIRVPDRTGKLDDVVLGYDTLEGYTASGNPRFFGAVVGRYGNRIANGRFTLDGKNYQLATNNGPNHLHGGVKGFDKVVWRAEPFKKDDSIGVVLEHTSPDGDEGYPGTLKARVTYTLNDRNELIVDYYATTDKPTPLNLTQHTYFNLAGDGKRDITDHIITIDADRYTPVDATMIPTGALTPVDSTPFDFRKPTRIGARIDADDEQIRYGLGYDHNFVLNSRADGLFHAVRLVDPASGRTLDVSTTQPGLQFFTGNKLDGSITGKAGRVYNKRFGLCLETQHFPDSPNKANFPSTILRPDEKYNSRTVFAFGVSK